MSEILKFRGNTLTSNGKECVNSYHHRKALEYHTNAHGRALRKMLEGWEAYAKAARDAYSEPGEDPYKLGDDHVLGPYWAEVGLAIKRLLDGEVGGWDCGSISGNILEAIEREGMYSPDGCILEEKGGE